MKETLEDLIQLRTQGRKIDDRSKFGSIIKKFEKEPKRNMTGTKWTDKRQNENITVLSNSSAKREKSIAIINDSEINVLF